MAGRLHELKALQISLPFLSNLPAEVDVKVTPRLAFKLNDAAFDSAAQATPFAQNRAADLKLAFTDVDLSPYFGYVPRSVSVRLKRANVSAYLAVKFEMPAGAQPRVSVQGSVEGKGVEVNDPADAPLLNWNRFKLALRDVRPSQQSLQFGDVLFDGFQLHARRDAKGLVNLQQWSQTKAPVESKSASGNEAAWFAALAGHRQSAPQPISCAGL